MKLFVNGRFLTQRTSGVQSFARELCRELIKETDLVILVPSRAKLYDNEFEKHIKRVGVLKGHLWEQLCLPLFFNKQKNAILLNLCNTGPLRVHNQISTIHDLAFLKNAAWFHPVFSRVYKYLIPRLVKKSEAVITVSNTIKDELIAAYKIPEKKIVVIGNKVAQDMIAAQSVQPKNKAILPKEYFLMVGSTNPRKNLTFVEHFFAKGAINKKLVIAGGSHVSFATVEKSATDAVIHLDYVSNEELSWLYKNASALINPSLYEGFGIPNIEAMQFDCTVVCSDIPAFKEVCKQSAFYFSLTDENSLKKCIEEVVQNKDVVAEKKAEGKKIVEQFQQQNRAKILLNILHR